MVLRSIEDQVEVLQGFRASLPIAWPHPTLAQSKAADLCSWVRGDRVGSKDSVTLFPSLLGHPLSGIKLSTLAELSANHSLFVPTATKIRPSLGFVPIRKYQLTHFFLSLSAGVCVPFFLFSPPSSGFSDCISPSTRNGLTTTPCGEDCFSPHP
jgi:hypothetical protein